LPAPHCGHLRFSANFPAKSTRPQTTPFTQQLSVAGSNWICPPKTEVYNLNKLLQGHPDAQLLVSSEYTFDSPGRTEIKIWGRPAPKYLIVGAKDRRQRLTITTRIRNGTNGRPLFRQAKAFLQFFKDGLPAGNKSSGHRLGATFGICICYDLRYSRVEDALVEIGAQAMKSDMDRSPSGAATNNELTRALRPCGPRNMHSDISTRQLRHFPKHISPPGDLWHRPFPEKPLCSLAFVI